MKLLHKDIKSSFSSQKLRIYVQITYSPRSFEKIAIFWFLGKKYLIQLKINSHEPLHEASRRIIFGIRHTIGDINYMRIIDTIPDK